jgi:signal transduction histidine kinase
LFKGARGILQAKALPHMFKQLLTFFYVLLAYTAAAQNEAATHILHQYTTENGLPSNLIRGIQWDDNTGFLWIITEGGLVRFNGVEFKSYSKEKISPIAPEKQVYAVKNNTGNIFISDGSGTIFQIKKNLPVLSKSAIANSRFINEHFIAVSESFFNAKGTGQPVFTEPFENVICLSDTACLILFQNILYKFSLSQQLPVPLFKNITTLFKIGSNCFFTDAGKQTFLLNTGNFLPAPVTFTALNDGLFSFTNFSSQLFWKTGMNKPVIIKENEAWQLNYENNSIAATRITNLLPTDANISTVEFLEDKGLLFIGTDSKGIIIISQNRVLPKKRKNANPKNKNAYFSQILLDNENILTNEGDVIGDNAVQASLPVKSKFSNRISYTNGNNLIWYNADNATYGENCLHQYNKTTGQTKVFSSIKTYTQVAVSGGKTYLVNIEGIGVFEQDSVRYLYKYPKNAANVKPYDLKEISDGVLAVAGCNGLLKFTTATNKLDTVFSVNNACFGSIWKYKDYIFWGSYGYGYYIYKNGRIKAMPVDKNEYLMYCHCFVEDAEGNCWISTNRGLFKAGLNDIITNFETGTTPIYYHYFGKNDGIEMTELNGGCTPCAVVLKDQTISFPSMDGLVWVNPLTAKPLLPAGDIYIDEILVDNNIANPNTLKNEELPAGVQDIVFNMGYAAWCNKENLYIDYQLNDTLHWKKLRPEESTSLQFSNLPAGKYSLRIRKLNGFGINNYSYKTIEFTIAKRWFNQWWFYMLVMGAITGIIYLFIKLRNRQYIMRQRKLERQVAEKTKELQHKNEVLEKNDTIKTRLISIISHDIVTPLKFLTMAGKNLVEKKAVMPEQLQEDTLKEMATTSQELHQLSTNILNWIKYQNENRRLAKEKFNVHDVAGHVMGIMQTLAKQKKLLLQNNIPENMELNQYLEPLRILLYNLVANAINFTEKGRIIISSVKENNKTIITVTDEGVGMTPEQIQNILGDQFIVSSANIDNRKGNGLGYLIIKDLLKMMGATLQIKSEKGKGTIISIILNE